jgi:hypothetical protein
MPIEAGFKATFSGTTQDVPELTPIAIHPRIQAERDNFDAKAIEYIKVCHVRTPEALGMLGDLKKNMGPLRKLCRKP